MSACVGCRLCKVCVPACHLHAMDARWRCCGLFLAFLIHDGLVNSLAPRPFSSRIDQHVFSLRPSQARRLQHQCNMSPSQQPDAADSGIPSSTWSPVRFVLSSLLATTVVLTGALPGLEPGCRSTVVPTIGVRAAGAASFNDEQRAIAETWVSHMRVR